MSSNDDPLSRREFLKAFGTSVLGVLMTGCGPQESLPEDTNTPAPTPPHTATTQPATPIEASPTAQNTPQPPTATPYPNNLVATARVPHYAAGPLRTELERMIASLGGFSDLLKPQSRVGIKVNLTGGTWWDAPDKPPANEYFATHPAVVGALCELLIDAGASRLVVMDGLGDETNFDAWGYTAMAAPLGVELLDLCKPYPYRSYGRFPVGEKSQIYSEFLLNATLAEIDMLISVAKLKCHSVAGVTLSLKNQIGLAPINEYRLDPQHNNRSAFHGSEDYDTRLPRVIIDLNLACPVHFAVVDGIATAEGGAGPWDEGLSQVKPGLLFAGRNPVSVDAVCTAVMGFDPETESGVMPFNKCDNHLALAQAAGLGTHVLADIPIAGLPVEEIRFPFQPAA